MGGRHSRQGLVVRQHVIEMAVGRRRHVVSRSIDRRRGCHNHVVGPDPAIGNKPAEDRGEMPLVVGEGDMHPPVRFAGSTQIVKAGIHVHHGGRDEAVQHHRVQGCIEISARPAVLLGSTHAAPRQRGGNDGLVADTNRVAKEDHVHVARTLHSAEGPLGRPHRRPDARRRPEGGHRGTSRSHNPRRAR